MSARAASIVIAVTTAALACSSGDGAKAKADSVAAHDSAVMKDSINAAMAHTNDSLAAAAGNASGGAAPTVGTSGETRKINDPATSNAAPGNIVGRDSAVGPKGMMDANGNITKIKRK